MADGVVGSFDHLFMVSCEHFDLVSTVQVPQPDGEIIG